MAFTRLQSRLVGGCVVLLPALGWGLPLPASRPSVAHSAAGPTTAASGSRLYGAAAGAATKPIDIAKRDSLGFSWQQTMLRIKDPALSLPYYEEKMGMRRIHEYHFDKGEFSLYFLASVDADVATPQPGTREAEKLLWNYKGTVLELTHNHGTEKQEGLVYDNGNNEPHRGFGHIAFAVPDVYEQSEELEKSGVDFKKRPNEGRMKGLSFALDPTNYWVEILNGTPKEELGQRPQYTFAQTMIRIKDPAQSLRFYCDVLGMKLLAEKHFDDFSLYFLQHPQEDLAGDSLNELSRLRQPILELTHNHGTENEEGYVYHNGNSDPRGFGHIGFLCNDLNKACEFIDDCGSYGWVKRPEEGSMRNIAFTKDPDGYWVELIQKDATFM